MELGELPSLFSLLQGGVSWVTELSVAVAEASLGEYEGQDDKDWHAAYIQLRVLW